VLAVRGVVDKVAQRRVDRPVEVLGVGVGRQAGGMLRHRVPEAENAADGAIAVKVIARMRDPEHGRRGVAAQQRVRLRIDAEIAVEHVLDLVSVLDEVAVAAAVVGGVALHQQLVGAVHGDAALKRVVNRVAHHVRVAVVARDVKVDRIARQLARLAHVEQLGVLHAQLGGANHHDVAAPAGVKAAARHVAVNLDVARQQRHLGAHVDRVVGRRARRHGRRRRSVW
jgi:hypothetical protein